MCEYTYNRSTTRARAQKAFEHNMSRIPSRAERHLHDCTRSKRTPSARTSMITSCLSLPGAGLSGEQKHI
jgi:hypothetical protein